MFRFHLWATAVIAILCLAAQPGAAAPLQSPSSDPNASPLLHMVQFIPIPDDDDDDGWGDDDDDDDDECVQVGPVTYCE
jgi:hypothetical protein